VNKRILWNAFQYLLAFGLLGFVVWQNWAPEGGRGLRYVWERHVQEGQPIHWDYFAVAAAVTLAAVLLTQVRWFVLVRAQDLPFTIGQALRLGMIAFFFNSILPGSVGGDVVKAAGLARQQSRRTVAVATVIMDRIIALWGLVWFVAMLGSAFWAMGMLEGGSAGPAKFIVQVAVGVVLASVVVWLLLGLLPADRAERFAGRLERLPKVGGPAGEFWRAVWMYRCRQKSVAAALLLSWMCHVGFVVAFYSFAHVLWDVEMGDVPGLAQHFLIVPIGLVIQAAPLFPGGAGIGEAGFGGLYKLFGCPSANGVLASLVKRVTEWGVGLGSFLFLMLRRPAGSPTSDKGIAMKSEAWIENRSENVTTR
jgi:glycosyltransferase 2 family protein